MLAVTKLPLTVEEAATYLGVKRSAVQMAILRGRITATKRAGAWWIEPREVERYAREVEDWRKARRRPLPDNET